MSEGTPVSAAPYLRYAWTSCAHTLTAFPRKKMSYLAAFVAFTPAIIPIALTFPDQLWYEVEGKEAFVRIAQLLYIYALSPLLGLLFGCMLIGEDVESETFPYILTRPIPRSAWILGKFCGYMIGVPALLLTSMAITFAVSTRLSNFPFSMENLGILATHSGVLVLALAGYGGVALLLGASVKRPMILGLILFFLWQRFALALPGRVDFLTIDKYLSALLPETEGLPSLRQFLIEVAGIQKLDVPLGSIGALITLVGIAGVSVALTGLVVQRREYFSARSMGA